MFYWTENLPPDIHRPVQLDRWYWLVVRLILKTNNLKTIIILELTSVLFVLQKTSEINQDSTSKAPNMQIQQWWCLLHFLTRSQRSQKNSIALNSRGGNRRCSSTWPVCIRPNSCKRIHRNPKLIGTRSLQLIHGRKVTSFSEIIF